jgi:hypothetical protein
MSGAQPTLTQALPTPTLPELQAKCRDHAAAADALVDTVTQKSGVVSLHLAIEQLASADADPLNTALAAVVSAVTGYRDAISAAATSCDAATAAEDAAVFESKARSLLAQATTEASTLDDDTVQKFERVTTVAALDKAALSLVAAFTTITAALTTVGFATGDYTGFYRNYLGWALAYLILAIVAVLIGTFAFLIDAVQDNVRLRIEQFAIYAGIVAFGVSFCIAASGLAVGSSGGSNRPAISASVIISKTDGTAEVKAQVDRSDVQRSDALTVAVWGDDAKTSLYELLEIDVTGPDKAGAVTEMIDTVEPSASYRDFVISASVGPAPAAIPTAPPANCALGTTTTEGKGAVTAAAACAAVRP